MANRSRPARMGIWLLLAVCCLGVGRTRADEVIERVVAVVGGDIILQSDVTAARELALVDLEGGGDAERRTLNGLINRALMLNEVNRYAPPEPTDASVDTALAQVRARAASPSAFQTTLARLGLEERHLREILRQNLRLQAYLDQRFPATSAARQRQLIDDWLTGLRRRTEIVDLAAAP